MENKTVPHEREKKVSENGVKNDLAFCLGSFIKKTNTQWKESFPNICGLPLLLFFWLKWAGYLAVAGLNLLAQISDRISPSGV